MCLHHMAVEDALDTVPPAVPADGRWLLRAQSVRSTRVAVAWCHAGVPPSVAIYQALCGLDCQLRRRHLDVHGGCLGCHDCCHWPMLFCFWKLHELHSPLANADVQGAAAVPSVVHQSHRTLREGVLFSTDCLVCACCVAESDDTRMAIHHEAHLAPYLEANGAIACRGGQGYGACCCSGLERSSCPNSGIIAGCQSEHC
mmetsp:Transcript_40/g.108  ORF Transcript_40/g.108 Transcript_40/m.108 type:complete len:200 (-) Transcript_40:109-708(-)